MTRVHKPRERPKPLVRGWRWRIAAGPVPLPFTWALPVAEAMRTMAMEAQYAISGSRRLPQCLHGGAAADRPGNHGHAFFLPEDADADGYIDHLLVHAPGGLTPAAIRILAHCDHLQLPGYGVWRLFAQWMGAKMPGGLYGPALVWASRSPVFAALNVHRLGLEDRVRRELEKRHLPAPETIGLFDGPAIIGGLPVAPEEFYTERSNGERAADLPRPAFLNLRFAEPLHGPLALGFAAHFGLGQFAPVPSSDQ